MLCRKRRETWDPFVKDGPVFPSPEGANIGSTEGPFPSSRLAQIIETSLSKTDYSTQNTVHTGKFEVTKFNRPQVRGSRRTQRKPTFEP